ncbi:MAG: hypothetical protein EPN30_00160 [Actinomycetota bacterium]|nr:MAG: hypothetical protein EPN30_00160 [Actinomycetota bacterium]
MASPDKSAAQAEAWETRTADTIASVVGTLRGKTVAPLAKITRVIIYGLLALVALAVVGILISVSAVRILDVYAFGNRVWISYFVIGGIITILGLLLWMKRTNRR